MKTYEELLKENRELKLLINELRIDNTKLKDLVYLDKCPNCEEEFTI